MKNNPKIQQNSYEILNNLIKELSEEELRLANQKIIERLNLLRSARQLNLIARFSVGERIVFDHNGRKICGTITRLNTKTVSVVDENGGRWGVSPIFIRKMF